MSWLDSLERRFGRFALPGLIRIVVALTALVYLLTFLNPNFLSVLTLEPARILRGEVWRLVTYIFIPSSIGQPGSMMQPLWLLLVLWFLLFIGDRLEQAWGAFRLNLYFLIGMVGTTIAAFFFGAQFSNAMLASSLFCLCQLLSRGSDLHFFHFAGEGEVACLVFGGLALLRFAAASPPTGWRWSQPLPTTSSSSDRVDPRSAQSAADRDAAPAL
jgi:hypothetical protein